MYFTGTTIVYPYFTHLFYRTRMAVIEPSPQKTKIISLGTKTWSFDFLSKIIFEKIWGKT